MPAPLEIQRTNAILFHRIRGSGREVRLCLGEHGVDLTSEAGAPIAIWPYETIHFVHKDATDAPLALRVAHDDTHELHIANPAWVAAITERSPKLLSARRTARWDLIGRIWSGVPDQAQAAVILGLLAALIGGIYTLFSWFAALW